MVWKYLAQVIVTGAQIVGRAFTRAVQEEIRASQQAAKNSRTNTKSDSQNDTSSTRRGTAVNLKHGMSIQEAVQILNIGADLNCEQINQNYEHLFQVNEKTKGGSLYLQSKVIRAKQRIDEELVEKERASTAKQKSQLEFDKQNDENR